MSDIRITKKLITPEQAQAWLATNEGNRKSSDKNVYFLYGQMAKGQWKLTGDTIKFDKKGKLKDGQHRLHALVKYGKPLEMFVCEGIEDDVFQVLDTGKNRSAGDVLSIKGYKQATNLAAATKQILLYKAGGFNDANRASRVVALNNTEVLRFVEENPDIYEVINYAWNIWHKFRFIPLSILAMLYWVCSKKNQNEADIFFEKYASGIDLSETSPIRLLRERLLKDSVNKSKLPTREKVALFIYAWNNFRQKKRTTMLTLARNYVFPKPI